MDHTTRQFPDWNLAPKDAAYFLAAQPGTWYATYHRADGKYVIADHGKMQEDKDLYNYHETSDRYKNCVKIPRQPNPNFNYAPADATHFGWENEEYNAGWYKLDSRGVWHFLSIHAKPGTKWCELDDDTSDKYVRYMETFVPRSHVFAPKPEETKSQIAGVTHQCVVPNQPAPENDIDNW